MASGHGVNGSGITGHSGVTGHDALVTVEMVRRRGVPRRQCRLEKRAEEGRSGILIPGYGSTSTLDRTDTPPAPRPH